MCGGGGSKSSTAPAAVDVKTVATPSRRDAANAGQFTDGTTATPASSTGSFGSELGGGSTTSTTSGAL